MADRTLRVAVVGATGLVGNEIVSLLAERSFPVGELLLFASERSQGEAVEFVDETIRVRGIERPMPGMDVGFLCATPEVSSELGQEMAGAGALVIDLAPGPGPWVLSASEVRDSPDRSSRVVRLPDPMARMIAVPLIALRALSEPRRVVATLLASASTFGRKSVDRLVKETTALLNFQEREEWPDSEYAFRCLPLDTAISTRVEAQLGALLGEELLRTTSVVRVPAFHGQAVSVSVELSGPVDIETVRKVLRGSPSLLVAEPGAGPASTLDAVGADGILVTGLRHSQREPQWLHLWALGDNVRQGAALAAVSLAEGVLLRH